MPWSQWHLYTRWSTTGSSNDRVFSVVEEEGELVSLHQNGGRVGEERLDWEGLLTSFTYVFFTIDNRSSMKKRNALLLGRLRWDFALVYLVWFELIMFCSLLQSWLVLAKWAQDPTILFSDSLDLVLENTEKNVRIAYSSPSSTHHSRFRDIRRSCIRTWESRANFSKIYNEWY